MPRPKIKREEPLNRLISRRLKTRAKLGRRAAGGRICTCPPDCPRVPPGRCSVSHQLCSPAAWCSGCALGASVPSRGAGMQASRAAKRRGPTTPQDLDGRRIILQSSYAHAIAPACGQSKCQLPQRLPGASPPKTPAQHLQGCCPAAICTELLLPPAGGSTKTAWLPVRASAGYRAAASWLPPAGLLDAPRQMSLGH